MGRPSRVWPGPYSLAIGLVLLLLLPPSAFATAYFTTVAGPVNWNLNTSWSTAACGGVAAGAGLYPGSAATADTATICPGNTITLTAAPPFAIASLTFNGGATAANLTITGQTLTVTGAVTMNNPTTGGITSTFTVGTGTLNAGSITINGGTGGGTRISILSISTGTVNATGNVVNAGTVNNGQLNMTGAGTVNVGGNFSVTGTGLNASGLGFGTIRFNGGAAQNIATSARFNHVTVDNGANTATLTGVITVGGNLTLTTGTLNDGGFQITGNAGGSVNMAAGTNLILGNIFPTAYVAGNILLNAASTVTYIANAARVISSTPGYGNLTLAPSTLSAARIYTFAAGTTLINGDFNINPSGGAFALAVNMAGPVTVAAGKTTTIQTSGTATGATLDAVGANNLTTGKLVIGHLGTFLGRTSTITLNATSGTLFTLTGATVGVFTPATSTVLVNPAADVTLNSGAITFSTLTVDMTGFKATLDPANNITISTRVNLTNGRVTTGTTPVVIATAASCATAIVSRTNGWVDGNLRKAIPAGASVCTFEVGGTSAYTPITATFIAGALASNVTAKSTDLDHASIATSGLDPDLTANRSWSLTSTAAEATAFSAVFNFVAGDLDTDTQPTTLFNGRQFSSAAWSTPTTGTRAATSTQLTALTLAAATQKDFVVGEIARTSGTGSFNSVENLANVITGKIFTKLAGTAFVLDLAALNAARTAADTTFKGKVKVELLDSSSGGALDANGCNAGWATIQTLVTTPQFLAADLGVKQNVSFTEANAWPNARVRVTYPATGTAILIGCSIDNFSIRPLSITSVVGGAPLVMNNTGTSGTPRAIAGSGTFTLIAATGLTGYAGAAAVPKIDNTPNTAVQAHAGAIQHGSVSGTFPAALAGTSTGTSAFTYSEVGNFKFRGYAATAGSTTARGVYDDTFTAVDGSSDCTADFSNVLAGGKYGCKFGITTDTSFFGRFYPANFVLTPGTFTNRRIAACAPASTFTYAGEEFRVTFTLTAKNGAGVPATTQNYDPAAGFASFNAATIVNLSFGAVDLADAIPPLTATALTASLTLGTSSGTWASGAVPVTADLMLTRAASPNGPFESFKLGIDPVDADGVKLSSYDLDTTVPADTSDHGLVGTSKIRFGRLRLQNVLGSELIDLPIPAVVQYWNGTAFVTNADDSCTSLSSANLSLGSYTGGITAVNMGNTHITPATISFAGPPAGVGNLKLTKPSPVPTSPGSATVTVNLAAEAKVYLQGNWGVPTYTANPSARAAFGLYGSQPRNFIFFRENY